MGDSGGSPAAGARVRMLGNLRSRSLAAVKAGQIKSQKSKAPSTYAKSFGDAMKRTKIRELRWLRGIKKRTEEVRNSKKAEGVREQAQAKAASHAADERAKIRAEREARMKYTPKR